MLIRYARLACKCRPTYLCPFCRRYGVKQAAPEYFTKRTGDE
jgi:hypothetical protein